MARSPLMKMLVHASQLARLRLEHHVSEEEARTMLRERRRFLKTSAAGSIAAAMSASALTAQAITVGNGNGSARIAIVGAGLAGLACAYDLKKAGLNATVYEASPRLGGRCFSNTTSFPGQVAENGGELIDTKHLALRQLAAELGLTLDDLEQYDHQQGGEITFWIDGAQYTWADSEADYAPFAAQIARDYRDAPWPQTYDNHTQRGIELDNMSARDWINQYVPGGMNSRQGKLLDLVMEDECGIPSTEASALNLVGFFGGDSDERYHIHGGNDQLVSGMAARLSANQILTGHSLKKIVRNPDATYTLTFATAGGNVVVTADQVVLALPCSILQSAVDYSQAGFDSLKQQSILNYRIAMHAKFQLQFNRRIWREQGYTGLTDSDAGYQTTWEVTRAQPGTEGILTAFSGSAVAVAMNDKPIAQKANDTLNGLELLFPGIKPLWNGRAVLNYWPGYPWTKGAYTALPIGYATRYHGALGLRQGNCHFAGEHTSVVDSGFMNGGVESGQRCAREIIQDLKGSN